MSFITAAIFCFTCGALAVHLAELLSAVIGRIAPFFGPFSDMVLFLSGVLIAIGVFATLFVLPMAVLNDRQDPGGGWRFVLVACTAPFVLMLYSG